MLLSITTTYQPATDLGYLLAKHSAKLQRFDVSFGSAYVFYPEATPARCTAALMLEVDPVALSRGRKSGGGPPLEPYVNDRPYVASSFLSVAIARVFNSALGGRCRERPELVETPIPLQAYLPAHAAGARRRPLVWTLRRCWNVSASGSGWSKTTSPRMVGTAGRCSHWTT